MDYQAEYRSKLRTPAEAVRAVKDGDWVDYTSGLGFPPLLDAALAARRDELHDVKVRGNLCMGPLQIVECDPEQTHFLYHTWHCSAYERRLCDRGLCYFTPMIFRNLAWYYRQFLTVNVAMACVTPMDRHGYFNLSAATGVSRAILEQADIVILEINEHLPRLRGGFDEVIHISDVDMIVEGAHAPFSDPPEHPASAEDTAIANLLLPHICDGATVQLGIGGMPTVLGKLLARSGLHDLGMHTELCSDAYLELHEAGVLTNRRCTLHRNQGMLGITIGSQRLYDWVDDNPGVIAAPLSYVNAPEVIAQLDFLESAAVSKGGKAFICMTSTFTDRDGVRHSRILPHFDGDIVTSPRAQAYYLATEQGVVNLAGRSTWERAEALVSIAHPDFRDELIRAAEAQKIWRRSAKR